MSNLNLSESGARQSDPEHALAAIMHQEEVWASAQGALLSRVETLWADWLHRRREAMSAASGSLQAMCDCHSLGELVQIQQRWLAGAIERSVADAEALVGIPIACRHPHCIERVRHTRTSAPGRSDATVGEAGQGGTRQQR